jgi:imidazolonepropionase-like amidohydrolase
VTPEQIRAAVQAAGARGRISVAHVATTDEATEAVHAGVDGLAHLWCHGRGEVRPETLARMAQRGTFVIPTLQVLRSICGQSRGETVAADAALRSVPRAEWAKVVGPQ